MASTLRPSTMEASKCYHHGADLDPTETMKQTHLVHAQFKTYLLYYFNFIFCEGVFHKQCKQNTFFDRIFRWYRSLCIGPSDKEEWKEGPVNISPQCQIAPMLLRMTWDGFPLYHTRKHGWGYLVPGRTDNLTSNLVTLPSNEDEHVETEKPELTFPTRYVDA